jgi:DNA modification methylase
VSLGTARVIRANSRHLPLANDSVDLVVTSPPYFALRSYQDGGEHYAGQIGDEPTPAEFVDSLIEVTRECVRVLKPSGSLWVNLGDKYSGAPSGPQGSAVTFNGAKHGYGDRVGGRRKVAATAPSKSLIGIPWRYALRCIDDLGLILRAEVIWSKPNGLPESVTDRVRRSHEQWFHFTLEPRYFSAVDEIREPHAQMDRKPDGATFGGKRAGNTPRTSLGNTYDERSPLGKLPGSVWTVPTEPLKVPDHLGVDHFAAFPTEWPKRIIQGWSPAGVCVECGEGRRPVTTVEREHGWVRQTIGSGGNRNPGEAVGQSVTNRALHTVTGYACACPEATADTTPAIVLDPFGGTGTTALVAKALGRHGISVDMSADYCRLAQWRTNDQAQLAKVLGLERPAPWKSLPDQVTFEELL